jgi:hypothetical protein
LANEYENVGARPLAPSRGTSITSSCSPLGTSHMKSRRERGGSGAESASQPFW